MYKYCLFLTLVLAFSVAGPQGLGHASVQRRVDLASSEPGTAFSALLRHLRELEQAGSNSLMVGEHRYTIVGAMMVDDVLGRDLLQAAVDEGIQRLLRSALGKSLCRDVFFADPDLLRQYLGVTEKTAESLGAECRDWPGERHPYVLPGARTRPLGNLDPPDRRSRVYSVWATSKAATSIRSVSHLDGWFTHLVLRLPPELERPEEIARLYGDFLYQLGFQVLGVFLNDENAWEAQLLGGNDELTKRLIFGPLSSLGFASMRASRTARALLNPNGTEASFLDFCVSGAMSRTKELFPYLSLGFAFDRTLVLFIHATIAELPVADRVMVELTIESLRNDILDNFLGLEAVTGVLGVSLVANAFDVFTMGTRARRDLEESRAILLERVLDLSRLFVSLATHHDNRALCERLSRPHLQIPTSPRRFLPELEGWSEKNY